MNTITILGLGAGELEQMPLGIYRHLLQQKDVFVRTTAHPVIKELTREGVSFRSFDEEYRQHEQFEQVYQSIVRKLITEAKRRSLTYAVPGHPFVAEKTIQILMAQAPQHGIELSFLGGQSFLDPLFNALQIDPIEGCQVLDGTALRRDELDLRHHLVIVQVYDTFIASDVKLTLMERLPDDYEVTIARAVGTKDEQLNRVPLYSLDRELAIDNLTVVYVPPVKEEPLLYEEFSTLRQIIATLRSPEGCPWDRKQTHQSLKRYMIEEAYEVIEAIEQEDEQHLVEELGDVLLQVMLHAQIGEDEGLFSVQDVIRAVTEKMIRRHPHVFAGERADNPEQVVANWEKIKREERGNTAKESMLASVSKGLPALMTAYTLQKEAAKVGFGWKEAAPIWQKCQEEMKEFMEEIEQNNQKEMSKEFGDILFAFVNLARFYELDAETALQSTNRKFRQRFQYIEATAETEGKRLANLSLEEMERLWEQSKALYN